MFLKSWLWPWKMEKIQRWASGHRFNPYRRINRNRRRQGEKIIQEKLWQKWSLSRVLSSSGAPSVEYYVSNIGDSPASKLNIHMFSLQLVLINLLISITCSHHHPFTELWTGLWACVHHVPQLYDSCQDLFLCDTPAESFQTSVAGECHNVTKALRREN